MAHTVILGPREHHLVTSPGDLRQKHAAVIKAKAARGSRIAVHRVHTVVHARIDGGSWLFDCDCGAGVATDPEWGIGCCFACGATYASVQFPSDREDIEAAILARPRMTNRHWRPGESRDALMAENIANGLEGA